MKRLIVSVIFLLSVLFACIPVSAEVMSTREPTAADTIYIAGNPNMYPLEFYNEKTECYEGILPKIYEQISEQTGIDFSYVSADSKDRQKELCENFQVEIASAHHKGDISLSKEIELFSYDKDGKKQTVCIGFTKIMNPDMAAAVETAVQSADKTVWMSAAMQLEDKAQSAKIIPWLIIAISVLVLALITMFVYIIVKRHRNHAQNQTKMTDALTGIGNLSYFEECYSHHISSAMRSLYYVAYIAIDIEKIETYFGLPESEELQRYAAATMTGILKDNDFASRIDNGVFACCFMCPDTQRAIESMTELIRNLNSYNGSFSKDNGVLFRGGVYPLDKQNLPTETVIYNARQGYLLAVNEDKDVCLCDKNTLNRVSIKSRLQKKISKALENEEFQIYLQFVFDTKKKNLCGAEVLSRWHSLEEGVLSPENYIEDMKLAGMIDKLDFYIFEKTCKMLADWKNTDFKKLYLSCNFTRTTLSQPTFLEEFEEALSKYDFDRKNLLIELTEDALVSDSSVAYKNILGIKKIGCGIALDDFGTGYTSFSDLCDYPIDVIKIDRHIVAKSVSHRGNAVLIGIIRMAHDLGISVLCEGIENEVENQKVTDAECDYIQGFLYSRVLPIENALEFYKNKQ